MKNYHKNKTEYRKKPHILLYVHCNRMLMILIKTCECSTFSVTVNRLAYQGQHLQISFVKLDKNKNIRKLPNTIKYTQSQTEIINELLTEICVQVTSVKKTPCASLPLLQLTSCKEKLHFSTYKSSHTITNSNQNMFHYTFNNRPAALE